MPMVISRRTVSMMTILDDLRLRYLRLRSAVNKAKHKRARYRGQRSAYIRTLHALQSSSDRDLADIGMSRLSIKEIAHEAAYGVPRSQPANHRT